MMAPEPADPAPPQRLSTEITDQLRGAILRALGGAREPDEDLRDVVRDAVGEAHERVMRAEDLVIACKAIFDAVPKSYTPEARARRAAVRERLVSLSIKAYYASERHDAERG